MDLETAKKMVREGKMHLDCCLSFPGHGCPLSEEEHDAAYKSGVIKLVRLE